MSGIQRVSLQAPFFVAFFLNCILSLCSASCPVLGDSVGRHRRNSNTFSSSRLCFRLLVRTRYLPTCFFSDSDYSPERQGVVNALLLFNTFRVLGPAFEARSSIGQQGDLESFGTAETFKRLTTDSFATDSKGPLHLNLTDAMIQEYRATGPSISSNSSYKPTVSYPERVLSTRGLNRFVTSDDVSRQISPVSTLNQSIVVEVPGSMIAAHPPVGIHNPRQLSYGSMDSVISLPVPPRRTPTPTPLILDHSSQSNVSSRDSVCSTSSPILRPAATLTPRKYSPSPRSDDITRFSAASTTSSMSGELDMTGWSSGQNSAEVRNEPMLSAVKPTFPSSMPSPDPSATAAARLRPLLLASVERTGSMFLAEQYNRMYVSSPNGSFKSTWEEDM